MTDGLMLEEKKRLTVLVIEDDHESAVNAKNGLLGHDVTLVTNLIHAKELMLNGGRFDVILSDAHVPIFEGGEPASIVSEVIDICFGSGTPTCFVTRADHHGIPGDGEGECVSLKAISSGRVFATYLETSEKKPSDAELFRMLKTTESESIRCRTKTPEIWWRALQMAANASVEVSSLGKAIRQIRKTGLDVTIKSGIPRVVQKK